MRAKVRVFWDVSVSPDVTEQRLLVKEVNGGELASATLEPTVGEFVFVVDENVQVHVELRASDGQNVSEAATLDFTIGDLTVPAAPTNLGWEIVEKVD